MKNLRFKLADIVFALHLPSLARSIAIEKNYLPFQTTQKSHFDLFVRRDSFPFSKGPAKETFRTTVWDYFHYPDKEIFRFFSSEKKKYLERILLFNSDSKSAELFLPKPLAGRNGALRNPFSYPLDEILLINLLSARQSGSLVHSCGISYHNKGYLFIGSSGAGKSTLSLLFKNKKSVNILSDDRIIVKKNGRRFFIYGTPWCGSAEFASSKTATLTGLFFLKKDRKNTLRRLSLIETAARLLQCSFPPFWSRDKMESILGIYESLSNYAPAFEFSFRPDQTAADFMSKKIAFGDNF